MSQVFRHRRKPLPYAVAFALLQLGIHLAGNSRYGFHRDELLYLALGDHPGFGYKEVPPFIAMLAWLLKHSIGTGLFAVRLLPALCSALIVYLSCRLVIDMGGRRFAVVICGIAITFAPSFLASGYLFQPVVFDQLFWVLSAFFLVKYNQTRRPVFLYALGASLGFGMLNKYTMAFYGLALFAALLVSGQRKLSLNRHFWLAMLFSLAIFSPNLIWQITHHFPVVHHMRELRESQLEHISAVNFLVQQLLVHGTGVFVYLPGLAVLLVAMRLKNFRFIAWALFGTLLILLLGNGKSYYAFGAYPLIFSAGGYACERIVKSSLLPLRWALALLLFLPNILLLPLAVPVLPVGQALAYFSRVKTRTGVRFPFIWEDQQEHPLTQDYADMFGWDELAAKVAKIYARLPEAERKTTVIFATNYGLAGALDHFGRRYHLPRVVSLSSSFAIWAPEALRARHMIYVARETTLEHYGLHIKKMGEISSACAREKGTAIWWVGSTNKAIRDLYRKEWLALR